jgi:multiple sugar transport system permease protein
MSTLSFHRSLGRVLTPYAFLAPALLAIGVFFVLPVIAAFVLGFTDFDIYAVADLGNLRWMGLRNYSQLWRDPAFHTALRNTLYFVLLGGPLSIALSLAIALLVHHRLVRCKSIFRTIFLLPVVCTLVAVAVVWRYLYQPRDGVLNLALAQLGLGPIDWLGDPRWAMPAIILMALWKNFGFNMLIFLAALQRVPESLFEAARLDGAGAWQELCHVTVPMLRPTLQFVAVITLAGYFQLFAEPYVMTGGGPADSTLSVVLLMYREGFRWWNMGYAAAVSFVLFALILAATRLVLGRGAMASTATGGSR